MVRDAEEKTRLAVTGEDRKLFLARTRRNQAVSIPYDSLMDRYVLAERSLSSGKLLILSSMKKPSGGSVLYLYGSLFLDPPKKEDFRLAGKLVDKTGCDVCFLLMPLFPDHSLKEMVASVEEALFYLTTHYARERTAVLAFSTSCLLCLDALGWHREQGSIPMPGRLILNSPILRIPASEALLKQMKVLDRYDVRLPIEFFAKDGICGSVIEAEETGNQYLRDPLFGSLYGLPATDVYYGTNENAYVYLPELTEAYRRADIPLTVHKGELLMHCWSLYDNCEEAKHTIQEYIEIIRGLG
ncbi:MAG: hypothetical protein IKG37_06420 [Solobacterium sp.]|nr:hypothetical protein [Solobacterium sp.]